MNDFKKNWPAVLILLVGAVFLAAGVWRGEDQVVFRKAVNICMECIGLG